MEKDTGVMLKKVVVYDLIIIIIASVITIISFKEYALIVAAGIVIALANFVLNAVIANLAVMGGKGSLPVLGAIARVIVTAVIAVVLCGDNANNYIAFIVGYSLHYISIVLYGAALGRKHR